MSFCFNPDFVGFQGHFPDYPLLPAFVQVLAAIVVAEESTGGPLRLVSLDKAKFQKEIKPGDTIMVECEKTGEGHVGTYRVRLSNSDVIVSSFTMNCRKNR